MISVVFGSIFLHCVLGCDWHTSFDRNYKHPLFKKKGDWRLPVTNILVLFEAKYMLCIYMLEHQVVLKNVDMVCESFQLFNV